MILKRYIHVPALVVLFGILSALLFAWQQNTSLESCDGAGVSRQQCFADQIDRVVATKGLSAAFDTLVAFSKEDANFATACHGNAHELGDIAYYRFAKGEKIEYTPKMSYCGYGFFHGFIEALFSDTGSIDKVVAFCESLDRNLGSVSGGTNACFHGIGHGAVDGTDPRSWGNPALMIRPAMDICNKLPEEKYALYLCQSGVYNSLELLSIDPKYHLEALTSDPYAFCNNEPRVRRDSCYVNMIPVVLRIAKDDVQAAARYIVPRIPYPDDTTVDGYRIDTMVIRALFSEFVRLNFGHEEAVVRGVELCRTFPDDRLRLSCVTGLSEGHMKYGTPDSAYEKWRALCEDSSLREDERKACFEFVLKRISLWYDTAHAKAICQSVPEQYQGYCNGKLR